ncbi:MAG: DegV family protein, partial [Erysipelotrichales bacterium]
MKIAYLVDSSICISYEDQLFKAEDCFFIPLHLMIDNNDYIDNDKLDRNMIIEEMKKAKKIVTSQPTIFEVEAMIDDIIDQGYDVLVCALIGSGLSGTQNLIYSCALNKKITVVNLDSKGVGPMQG